MDQETVSDESFQKQVQVFNWEPSFQLHELLDERGKDSFGVADLFERVQLTQNPTAVNVRHLAYQLFDKMLPRNRREQYNNQQLKISKSWHFKFKSRATRVYLHANLWYNVTIEDGDTKDIEVEYLIFDRSGQQVYRIHAGKSFMRWYVVCVPGLWGINFWISVLWNRKTRKKTVISLFKHGRQLYYVFLKRLAWLLLSNNDLIFQERTKEMRSTIQSLRPAATRCYKEIILNHYAFFI